MCAYNHPSFGATAPQPVPDLSEDALHELNIRRANLVLVLLVLLLAVVLVLIARLG